jgi:hypothetical protein
VNGFCPEGYVPMQKAIVSAAEYWFAQEFAAIMAAATNRLASTNELESGVQRLARVLSQLSISDGVRLEAADIMIRTANKLRHFLHEGRLVKAYYFGDGLFADRHGIASEFWGTTDADGVLESGIFFPFGRPGAWHERRPYYPVFLLQAELDALLSELKTAKKRLPESKKPALAAALGRLDNLPNRKAQLKALRELPEFSPYKITDAIFREATRKVPRGPGVKRKRD